MDYQGTVIRPPSEARSLILQVTVGCSHNRCTFCGAYKDKKFAIKDQATLESDLEEAAAAGPWPTVFLADGDVLSLGQKRLCSLLALIRARLPGVRRIRLYGNCRSIRGKSADDLRALRALGLDRIYLGLESGHDAVLKKIRKGASSRQMIEAARKVRSASIFLSVTVLLGIGGVELSAPHARATAWTLNRMAPNQIAALTLMPVAGTPLAAEIDQGRFTLPDRQTLLAELDLLVAGITLPKVMFQANHASNLLPIDGRLQRDREKIRTRLRQAMAGELPLMPDYLRGL